MTERLSADLVRPYVYGWGRTKHLGGGNPPSWHGAAYPGIWALCGASGGNPLERPHLPVCQHCLRISARIDGEVSE